MTTEINSIGHTLRIGKISSILLSTITLITFGFAITAVPIAGPYCQEGCIDYPYLDSLHRFPKDYIWMYLAMVMLLIYVIFVSAIHTLTAEGKKIYSQIALILTSMASLVLLADYFIQSSVIPASLMNNETEGIPMLSQYNGHGIFIALEELGYLMMSMSFLFLAPAFKGKGRSGAFLRWILMAAFILGIISFLLITLRHGIVREYLFEVMIISVNWLTLVICGILGAFCFKR